MSDDWKPAVRAAQPMFIGLAGPAGCGKTVSALRIATGLADGGPVGVLDTENKRATQYCQDWLFLHSELAAPFTPERYIEKMKSAVAKGIKVLVVDSGTHEWTGVPGGVLNLQEEDFKRRGSKESAKLASWIEPKRRHNAFADWIEQCPIHLIMTLRAKEAIKPVKVDGKMEMVPMGWQPVSGDRLSNAALLTLILPEGSEGRPDLSEKATKLNRRGFPFIRDGMQLTEDTGRYLLEWSRGTDFSKPSPLNSLETDDRVILALRRLLGQLRAADLIQQADIITAPAVFDWLEKVERDRPDTFAEIAGSLPPAYRDKQAQRSEAQRQLEGEAPL